MTDDKGMRDGSWGQQNREVDSLEHPPRGETGRKGHLVDSNLLISQQEQPFPLYLSGSGPQFHPCATWRQKPQTQG